MNTSPISIAAYIVHNLYIRLIACDFEVLEPKKVSTLHIVVRLVDFLPKFSLPTSYRGAGAL